MKRVAALLVAALALAACSNGPERGDVVDKAYSPAYTWWTVPYYSQSCSGYNAKGACTGYIRTYISSSPVYVPDDWQLKLQPRGGEAGWRSVSESVWQKCTADVSYYAEGRCRDV